MEYRVPPFRVHTYLPVSRTYPAQNRRNLPLFLFFSDLAADTRSSRQCRSISAPTFSFFPAGLDFDFDFDFPVQVQLCFFLCLFLDQRRVPGFDPAFRACLSKRASEQRGALSSGRSREEKKQVPETNSFVASRAASARQHHISLDPHLRRRLRTRSKVKREGGRKESLTSACCM